MCVVQYIQVYICRATSTYSMRRWHWSCRRSSSTLTDDGRCVHMAQLGAACLHEVLSTENIHVAQLPCCFAILVLDAVSQSITYYPITRTPQNVPTTVVNHIFPLSFSVNDLCNVIFSSTVHASSTIPTHTVVLPITCVESAGAQPAASLFREKISLLVQRMAFVGGDLHTVECVDDAKTVTDAKRALVGDVSTLMTWYWTYIRTRFGMSCYTSSSSEKGGMQTKWQREAIGANTNPNPQPLPQTVAAPTVVLMDRPQATTLRTQPYSVLVDKRKSGTSTLCRTSLGMSHTRLLLWAGSMRSGASLGRSLITTPLYSCARRWNFDKAPSGGDEDFPSTPPALRTPQCLFTRGTLVQLRESCGYGSDFKVRRSSFSYTSYFLPLYICPLY
jgi:hypothetical protein